MTERTVCVVFTQAVPGRDAEYNEWYDRQHLNDVLRIHGAVSAQRFDLVDGKAGADGPPTRCLAIYEVQGDLSSFVAELRSRFGTDKMPASGALDLNHLSMTFWKAREDPVEPAG